MEAGQRGEQNPDEVSKWRSQWKTHINAAINRPLHTQHMTHTLTGAHGQIYGLKDPMNEYYHVLNFNVFYFEKNIKVHSERTIKSANQCTTNQ